MNAQDIVNMINQLLVAWRGLDSFAYALIITMTMGILGLMFTTWYMVLGATFGAISTLINAISDRIRGIEIIKLQEETEKQRPIRKIVLFPATNKSGNKETKREV